MATTLMRAGYGVFALAAGLSAAQDISKGGVQNPNEKHPCPAYATPKGIFLNQLSVGILTNYLGQSLITAQPALLAGTLALGAAIVTGGRCLDNLYASPSKFDMPVKRAGEAAITAIFSLSSGYVLNQLNYSYIDVLRGGISVGTGLAGLGLKTMTGLFWGTLGF